MTKLPFEGSNRHFDEKHFWKTSPFFELWSKLFLTFGNFSLKVNKTAFQVFRRTIWWKVFFWKTLLQFFSDFERNIFWLSTKNLQKNSHGRFLRVKKIFRRNRFLSIFCLIVIFGFSTNFFPTFSIKNSRMFLKLLTASSAEQLNEKYVSWKLPLDFLEIDRIIFWHLAKIFPQSWQKYFWVFRRTLW